MKIICITGGMGAGKSMVAKVFETLGYPVYYSDERAKAMYFLPEVKEKITSILGKDAYLNATTINKQYIADRIFSDKNLLNQVNDIIHSAVKKDFQEFVKEHIDTEFIFKESALIFEAQLQATCHKIILVTAPKEIRIKRIKKRDNLNENEINKRMNQQMDDDEKIKTADYVIYNDESEPLLPKVLNILENLKASSIAHE